MGYKHLVFPEGSTFLVTGGAGFIGSNLCEAILDMGYNVRCLDDLSTGRKENVDMLLDRPEYTFIKGDRSSVQTTYPFLIGAPDKRIPPSSITGACCVCQIVSILTACAAPEDKTTWYPGSVICAPTVEASNSSI